MPGTHHAIFLVRLPDPEQLEDRRLPRRMVCNARGAHLGSLLCRCDEIYNLRYYLDLAAEQRYSLPVMSRSMLGARRRQLGYCLSAVALFGCGFIAACAGDNGSSTGGGDGQAGTMSVVGGSTTGGQSSAGTTSGGSTSTGGTSSGGTFTGGASTGGATSGACLPAQTRCDDTGSHCCAGTTCLASGSIYVCQPTAGTSSGGTSAGDASTGGATSGACLPSQTRCDDTGSHCCAGTTCLASGSIYVCQPTAGTSSGGTSSGGASSGGTSSGGTSTGGASSGGTSSGGTSTGGASSGGTSSGGTSTGGASTGGGSSGACSSLGDTCDTIPCCSGSNLLCVTWQDKPNSCEFQCTTSGDCATACCYLFPGKTYGVCLDAGLCP
jgi:hypothetical protein